MRGMRRPVRAVAWFLTSLLPAILLLVVASSSESVAQTSLDRISVVERSDGKGHVIRYHLSQRPDSFLVRQPANDLIQLMLFADRIDTTGLRYPSAEPVERVIGYRLDQGYGFDILLNQESHFAVQSYPDQNRNDLLLALTRSTPEAMSSLYSETEPLIWSDLLSGSPDGEVTVVSEAGLDAAPPDDDYAVIRGNMTFDTVVIDAGHGGKDPGTIGHGGIQEKHITLSVAKKVGNYIKENLPDVNVVYTRDDDTFVELQERGRLANQAQGDLFVSIHANAFPQNPNVRGSEIYFLGLARSRSALEVMKRENSVVRLESGNGLDELTEEDLLIYELANAGNISISERIAGKMEYQFRERARRHSRGVKQAQFVVLYHASMPALLVELGFVTNPDEARYLSSDEGQNIVASAIYRAIKEYKQNYERSMNITRSE